MVTTDRRKLLQAAGALTLAGPATFLAVRPSAATPASMQAAIKEVVGTAKIVKGKVSLDIPPLVENGNVVPITVTVDSPMTAESHVTAIHVFNEANPQPSVINVKLGPRAGKAVVSTRIRLATSQPVIAIAAMNDGTFWSDQIDVIVTAAACLEANL